LREAEKGVFYVWLSKLGPRGKRPAEKALPFLKELAGVVLAGGVARPRAGYQGDGGVSDEAEFGSKAAGDGVAGCGLVLTTASLSAQEPRLRATLKGHTDGVQSMALSPDGQTLASGGESIMLWDIGTRKHIAILKGHTESVLAVAFSPVGTMLASGSRDRTIKLWDMPAAKQADK
jgi:hypothetical protein